MNTENFYKQADTLLSKVMEHHNDFFHKEKSQDTMTMVISVPIEVTFYQDGSIKEVEEATLNEIPCGLACRIVEQVQKTLD